MQRSNTCGAIPELGYKNSVLLLILDSDSKQLRALYLNVEMLLSLCFATYIAIYIDIYLIMLPEMYLWTIFVYVFQNNNFTNKSEIQNE